MGGAKALPFIVSGFGDLLVTCCHVPYHVCGQVKAHFKAHFKAHALELLTRLYLFVVSLMFGSSVI